MDAGPLVLPPRVARPLRLLPFRGIMLAAGRIGAPSSVRAFTRPYREVPNRLQRWEAGGQLIHDAEPAVYLHEFTADGTTVRGLVGALDISRQASARGDVAVFPHEGVHPAQADELAARMTEMQTNPHRSCWCTVARPRSDGSWTPSSSARPPESSPTAAASTTASGRSATAVTSPCSPRALRRPAR